MVEAVNTPKQQQDSSDGEEMTYGDYMILSARQGDLEAVKECLQEDVPVNHQDDQGNTALHMASANNHCDLV